MRAQYLKWLKIDITKSEYPKIQEWLTSLVERKCLQRVPYLSDKPYTRPQVDSESPRFFGDHDFNKESKAAQNMLDKTPLDLQLRMHAASESSSFRQKLRFEPLPCRFEFLKRKPL